MQDLVALWSRIAVRNRICSKKVGGGGGGMALSQTVVHTVTCEKFKYNFTHFKDCHVISAICYTVYSKDSLFNSLKIAVIKHGVVLKSNHMLVII